MSEWLKAQGIDIDVDEIHINVKYTDYAGQQYVTVKKEEMEKLLGVDKLKDESKRLMRIINECNMIAWQRRDHVGMDMLGYKNIYAITEAELKSSKKPA